MASYSFIGPPTPITYCNRRRCYINTVAYSSTMVWSVVELRRVYCELLSKGIIMGCYLEDYRAWVGTWTGRFSWRGVSRRGDANGTAGDCLGLTVLSSMVLAVLLVIGGVEQNPGPVVEVETTVRLLCSGCGRNLKSGIQCELCGRWYHYSCGSVKAQAAERENWNCNKCRTEKVKILQEELQKALRQIDELKARNRELEAKLQMAGTGERDTMTTKQKFTKC